MKLQLGHNIYIVLDIQTHQLKKFKQRLVVIRVTENQKSNIFQMDMTSIK